MPTKNTGIALATELQEAGKAGIMDIDVLMLGAQIVQTGSELSQRELSDLLFKYTANLAASVSARLTHVLLTETQLKDMITEIEMFEGIKQEVLGN